jgi:hypothetical protein
MVSFTLVLCESLWVVVDGGVGLLNCNLTRLGVGLEGNRNYCYPCWLSIIVLKWVGTSSTFSLDLDLEFLYNAILMPHEHE